MSLNRKLLYVLMEASITSHMKYNVEFVKALGKAGVDVCLLIEKGNARRFAVDWGMEPRAYFPPNVDVVFVDAQSAVMRVVRTFYHLMSCRVRSYKTVYVHYSFCAAFLASITRVFTTTYYWNCGMPWGYKRPLWQDFYEKLTYRVVGRFVTGSRSLIASYCRYYRFSPSKAIVIPNWIDIRKTRGMLDAARAPEAQRALRDELRVNGKQVLLFNQRLAQRKGAHYIPQIAEAVGSTAVVLVTNDGSYRETLLSELSAKGLLDRVRMLGRVTNDEVVRLLSITDLYILPSEEEGMSHSLMEAFATGVPAVAFDVGGTRDMYPDAFKDCVLAARDIDAFVQKVVELLNDPGRRAELGIAETEKVSAFDKATVVRQFIEKVVSS